MKSERRTLDHQLIFEARRLITGANVHRMKELIFAYEQAIDLHNRAWPAHRKYRREHEVRLRSYGCLAHSVNDAEHLAQHQAL